MKLKLFLALVFLNIGTLTAQEKLEVFFDFDQYEINADTNQKITDWITTSKNIEVQKIYGFCDWKGTDTYNDTLSLKRVYSVYDFLKNRNIKIKKD